MLLENVIKEKCPDYLGTFNTYIKHSNRIPFCNMFITKFEIFKRYCEWLFPIMEELEGLANESNTLASPRALDFIAEWLCPLYFYKNSYKIKHLPIVVSDPSKKKVSNLRYFCSYAKSTLRFWLNI